MIRDTAYIGKLIRLLLFNANRLCLKFLVKSLALRISEASEKVYTFLEYH